MTPIPADHHCSTPLLNTGGVDEKRAEIRDYFLKTWELYENLFEILKDDTVFYERPEPLRHPLIFYFGHTATFFANKLVVAKILDRRLNPKIESMMAIGVDEMSWDDLDESHYDWPSVDEVRAYRNEVKSLVVDFIDTLPLSLPIVWDDPFWMILMGIEHERIHLETSSVLIRQLPLTSVRPHANWPFCSETSTTPPTNTLIDVKGGTVTQGRNHPEATYGWDNEYGELTTEIQPFKASQHLVSQAEYLEFIQDNGYQTQSYWTEEGWAWVQFTQATMPHFWRNSDDGVSYRYRTLTEEIDIPWSWPVDVNQLEAKAFCNWLSKKNNTSIRLPSEAEWYHLATQTIEYDQGGRTESPANIDLKHWASSCPVDQFPHGAFFDVTGNVWQWTESTIDGFDEFAVHPAYDDFSVPTFDGRHNLIKGGSWISTGNESLRDSRYAFRRHFTQHAGFRYVESPHPVVQDFNPYESDPEIANYLEHHYGKGEGYKSGTPTLPNFQKSCVDTLMQKCGRPTFRKVLDIGCAVGRSSFELAQHAEHVDAVDFSTRFIRNALNLADHGSIRYLITGEGEIQLLKQSTLDDIGLATHAHKVTFTQGDAANLKPIYRDYDLIFAGNLIEHLYEPSAFLRNIHERLTKNGILVITSTYDWDTSRTKKENWLGGIKINGENKTTHEALYDMLSPQFEELAPPIDLPYLFRKTTRTADHGISQMTLWVKRS